MEGSYKSGDTSSYNLSVEFSAIKRLDNEVLDSANNKINVINLYNKSDRYKLSGKILGYENSLNIKLNGRDTVSIPFVLRKDEALKEFIINLSKENFEKITDFSLMIFDENGNVKEKVALHYSEGNIEIANTFISDSVNLRLMLVPAFANKPGTIIIHVKEKTYFNYLVSFSVNDNASHVTTLYPDIEKTLDCEFSEPYQFIPGTSIPFGKIYFESEISNKVKYEIPVYFNF